MAAAAASGVCGDKPFRIITDWQTLVELLILADWKRFDFCQICNRGGQMFYCINY